jgi:hypothetical protein
MPDAPAPIAGTGWWSVWPFRGRRRKEHDMMNEILMEMIAEQTQRDLLAYAERRAITQQSDDAPELIAETMKEPASTQTLDMGSDTAEEV